MANGIASVLVLQPDQFKDYHSEHEDVTQASYYRGAPPKWENFYLAEKNEIPLVKREGYERVRQLIRKHKRDGRKTVTKINLLHQPGTGGSTLAMQVLWDLRKELLCTTLRNTEATPKVISHELIKLGREERKTVLLLLDNVDSLEENLQKSLYETLIDEVNKTNINFNVPVVIILNCVRKDEFRDEVGTNTVVLRSKLQNNEKHDFDKHSGQIRAFFRDEYTKFHGFNIIQRDFDSMYVQDVCNPIVPPKIQPESREVQLFAILALVNSYAPSSDFALDQCEKFLVEGKFGPHSPDLFQQEMKTFLDLLVTFTTVQNLAYVHVAHPMIAKECIRLLFLQGTSRSRVTKWYLKTFCVESPQLMMTAKTMLTMREIKVERNHDASSPEKKSKESKLKFSKLIQQIKNHEGKQECINVLKMATRTFEKSPTFPQTLARCYYLMDNDCECTSERDYVRAGHWANEATKRHPNNSFIMDTLGQVHKHHLFHYVKRKDYCLFENCTYANKDMSHFEVLRLGRLAINAFEKEGEAAEKEEAEESRTDAFTNISRIFNTRGKLGYLQVASKVFKNLQRIDERWETALTGSEKIPEELLPNLKGKYVDLVQSLRAEVDSRCRFFDKYLTYSKPGPLEDDPSYFGKSMNSCLGKYMGTNSENPGERTATLTNLQTFLRRQEADLGPILSSQTSPVESYHLSLLTSADGRRLSNVAIRMGQAYEKVYEKYFRSRHLVPLYMKSKEGWKTVNELGLQPREIEEEECISMERINGRVRRPDVFAVMEGTEISVQPYSKEKLLRNGKISFYMGMSIKGPMAFNIKYN